MGHPKRETIIVASPLAKTQIRLYTSCQASILGGDVWLVDARCGGSAITKGKQATTSEGFAGQGRVAGKNTELKTARFWEEDVH